MDASVAIIGAGTMGSGIAQVAAAAGHKVVVIDANRDALGRGEKSVAGSLAMLLRRSKITQSDADAILARIDWSEDLAAARGCSLVIEAIVERLDAKRTLFGKLAALVSPDTTIASNTSSLSITAMAEDLSDPARFVGLHFFNPVSAMKLVEIIAGQATDPGLVENMTSLMRAWGKHAVVVRDVPGFIVNRVARPFYAEAFLALEEGIDASLIDLAIHEGGGFRMGPLILADMIGHDVNYAAASSVFEGLQPDSRFRPQPWQARLVEAGLLGRKTGRGVYDYGVALPALPPIEKSGAIEIAMANDATQFAWLCPISNVIRRDDLSPGCIQVDGIVMAYGDGRLLSERGGIDVLLDYTLDPAASAIVAATAASTAAIDAIRRLAGSLGKRLLLIPDRPGQLVLRTLAQLANGAADAARDGVASEDAIDEAMIYGANYPEGPLHWAQRYGSTALRRVLTRIAAATGDDLYLPSTAFDQ